MTTPRDLDIAGDLGAATAGELRISGGAANLTIAGDRLPEQLYRAHFTGLIPAVTDDVGTVTVRYQRRLHPFSHDTGRGTVELSRSVPWAVHIHGAAADLTATLADLILVGMTIDGAVADTDLDLPRPVGEVTIRIDGPVRDLIVHRPAGVPIGIRIDGPARHVRIDGEDISTVGGGHRGSTPTAPDHYALVLHGAVDGLVVTD